jgi:hypothetical protein
VRIIANMASVEKAQEVVRRLTKKYGYLNEEMMSDIGNWKPEYRREIDENWLAMENTAAHSIKTFVFTKFPHSRNMLTNLQSGQANIWQWRSFCV